MASAETSASPPRVAIVGSGPSGFYAAEALLESDLAITVDMYERLPVPFGLVRYGVAPDHPKLKTAALVFDRIAQHPRFEFFGNVRVGDQVNVAELRQNYHAVLFCSGAESDRNLGIPGEDLRGSHAATEFVGWYNGHPDYRDREFDLSHEVAVIVGQGNVAADVARMLCAPIDSLAKTDIAEHALAALRESRVREVHIIGRRGPAQAKFTAQELRELGELPGVSVELAADDLALNPESATELLDRKNFAAAKNLELFRNWANRTRESGGRRIVFHFFSSPAKILGVSQVEGLVLARNQLRGSAFAQTAEATGESHTLPCSLVFRSIGYQGRPIAGLPFDQVRSVLHNSHGRVTREEDVYCSGWIKRGPSGIIGTNRACAVETVQLLIADLRAKTTPPKQGSAALLALLSERGVRVVHYADWRIIDAEELKRGQMQGKPREKFTRVSEMLAAVSEAPTTISS